MFTGKEKGERLRVRGNIYFIPDLIGCGTVRSCTLGVDGTISASSSVLVTVVVMPTSICGGGGWGGCGGGWVESLSVVVFQALSSPVSANTNLLLGRRLSILSDESNCESFKS